MAHLNESTLVTLEDLVEGEPKGSILKPCKTTLKHFATPDNLSEKLSLDNRTSLADYFRHKGISLYTLSVI